MAIVKGKSSKKAKDREIEISVHNEEEVLVWIHTKDSDRGYEIIVKRKELVAALIESGLISSK